MESDDENILVSNNNANSVQGHVSNKRRSFTLEPALVLLFFGSNLAASIVPNQLLKQTCLTYGYNPDDCANLGGNATREIEETIQPHVAEIMMTDTLINSIIPAVMSLFIGPWTDKFGRKNVIIATFFGFAASRASLTVVSILADQLPMINPWLYVLPSIPIILVGGWPTLIVSILCYVTDLSTEANRSFRIAIIEILVFVGVLFGTASSSFILASTSPTTVFLIGTICATIASVYALLFVEESVESIETASTCEKIKQLLSPTTVLAMLKTCFKRRAFKERRILWCLITILMFSIFVINGSGNVFYLFVREKFNWSLKDATLFDSTNLLISIIGCTIGLVLLKKILKFSDSTIAIIAIVCALGDSATKAFAQNGQQMYITSAIFIFKILTPPMCRSLISSVIPNTEIGKVYSIASSFEAVSSLVASPLYTYIYMQTFKYFAGAFYLITAGVYTINLILIYCTVRMRRTRESLMNPYTQIDNSS